MISRVVVVVPAADEQESIGACLRSLHAARQRLHAVTNGAVRSRVVVVLDDCRDDTGSIVAGFGDVEAVVSTARCVGAARHLGALRALALERPAREMWLASTDADCRVPADWLTRMVDDARRGAQLVLGTVRPEPGLPVPVERAWRAAHQVRDDHPHIHGANLGIAALTYVGLGGWRALPAHEDVDLVASGRARAHPAHRRDPRAHQQPAHRARGARLLELPERSARRAVRSELKPGIPSCDSQPTLLRTGYVLRTPGKFLINAPKPGVSTSPGVVMFLPTARGAITEALNDRLSGRVHTLSAPPTVADPLGDDDLQAALWTCYELHYRGFDDVVEDLEWDAEVLEFRRVLEQQFLSALRAEVRVDVAADTTPAQLAELVSADDGPPLSRYLERTACRREFEEFVLHRSVYHLKEADGHSWAIPRLRGAAKAALVTIQADEYGGGQQARMHSELFRATMRGLGLDDTYGRYVDDVPGSTLAISNLISLFGLHRTLRGALVGHLAAYEMTSSLPNRRYSRGLRRVGGDESACRFYDEHVTADALHEQLAAYDLCGGLVADEPELAGDVLFGAACALHLDNRFATWLMNCWREGRSSQRRIDASAATAS